ncbi:MAG: chemotaxis protein CheW [Gammaproteobacteria bacterium]|nr:chemotaxis protein CheW [Gammaproteobacteria bacterium]
MSEATSLHELRDKPFELLVELERRCAASASGRGMETGAAHEWVGVAFRVGDNLFVCARNQVREILTYPGVTKIPGSKGWLKGLSNIRGQLLPIIDMEEYFGGQETLAGRITRVIWVNHDDIPAGLLVDEVRGFRRFNESELQKKTTGVAPAIQPYLTGHFERDGETWLVLDLMRLVESQAFLQAAE